MAKTNPACLVSFVFLYAYLHIQNSFIFINGGQISMNIDFNDPWNKQNDIHILLVIFNFVYLSSRQVSEVSFFQVKLTSTSSLATFEN